MATRVEPGVDVVLEVLGQIVAELRGIRAALEQPRRPMPATVSREDRARLARVLPALAGVFGSDDFTAADLFTDDTPAAARIVVRGLNNARRVGRLFQRAEGVAVEGFAVERHGVELHVTLWRVVRVVTGKPNVLVPPPPAADTV